ncbi:MAG: hypothetical protein CVV48_08315 [Spirochaetae bacterium HGW-Spirochaetae-4]|jgi:hypothetical protein|nr:MAG: hypothetical protein CVV48_08315 [Spirochaetae bacterium HGW-Spirochaetae-4]
MYKTARQEQFSVAWVRAMAATLGLNTSKPDVDDDSVDLSLFAKDWEGGKISRPQIDVQIKCTTQEFNDDGNLHYVLSAKNYNDLSTTDVISPRYLFVVTIPEEKTKWVTITSKAMVLKNLGYWFSLRSFDELAPGQESKTILIPRANVLTKEQLYELMNRASLMVDIDSD